MEKNKKNTRRNIYRGLSERSRLAPDGKVIDIEKPLKKRDDALKRDGMWLSFDDALSMFYPTIINSLFDAKRFLNGKDIDKKAFSNGKTYYSIYSIALYLKNKNREAFLTTKTLGKMKGKERLVHRGVAKRNRIKPTPRIFNTLSKHKSYRDPDVELDVPVRKYRPYEAYRQYYGIFMFHSFIKASFLKYKKLEEYDLNFLLYAVNFQFLTAGDIYAFWGRKRTKTMKKYIKEMDEKGYIEFVRPSKSRKRARREFLHLYRTTKLAHSLIDEYMDYMMFKKKLPFTEVSHTKTYNKLSLTAKIQGPKKAHYFRAYALYSYFFEYLAKQELENPLGYSESEMRFAREESLMNYKYSAFMYLTLNELYKKDKISKFTLDNVKRFLARDVFADSGYKYVFDKKRKQSFFDKDYKMPVVPEGDDEYKGDDLLEEEEKFNEGIWTN